MTIKCESCGEQLELEVIPDIGQHIQCSTCGHKMSFSKPSRIELPSSATSNRTTKPKLGIRRPESLPPQSVDLNAQAIMRNMSIADQEKQQKQAREDKLWKKAQKELLVRKLLIILVFLGVAGGGVFAFMKYRAAAKQRQEQALAQYRAQQAIREQEVAQKREAAQKFYEQQKAQYAEEIKQQRQVQEQRYQAERKAQQIRESELAAKREERKRQQQLLAARAEIMRGFHGLKPSFCKVLPRDFLPTEAAATYCIVPTADEMELFVLEFKAEAVPVAFFWDQDGKKCELSNSEFTEKISGGAVFRNGKKCCLLLPRTENASWDICITKKVPSKVLLGQRLCHCIKSLLLNTDDFNVRVSIAIGKSGRFSEIAILKFDQMLPEELIENQVRAQIEKTTKRSEVNYKQTVMLYDGGIIKKVMGGLTMVPRKPSGNINYKKYNELLEEAQRQEREFENKYNEMVTERLEKTMKSVRISLECKDLEF